MQLIPYRESAIDFFLWSLSNKNRTSCARDCIRLDTIAIARENFWFDRRANLLMLNSWKESMSRSVVSASMPLSSADPPDQHAILLNRFYLMSHDNILGRWQTREIIIIDVHEKQRACVEWEHHSRGGKMERTRQESRVVSAWVWLDTLALVPVGGWSEKDRVGALIIVN